MAPDFLLTYGYAALAVLLYMVAVFVIATLLKDNSIVDIAWGPGFLLIALASLAVQTTSPPRSLLLLVLVAVWAFRLAGHIFARSRGKGEDYRYAAWRRDWGKMFYLKSFFFIFMLQGFLMLIIGYPIVFVASTEQPGLNLLDWAGVAVWCVGFAVETIGDYQLFMFKRNQANKGKIMRSGIWRYTRHPNYIGEAVLWWGVFLIALSAPWGWTTIVSPVTITFLLLRVSGVAMLEKKYSSNPEYEEYKRTTNAFIPWFPRR